MDPSLWQPDPGSPFLLNWSRFSRNIKRAPFKKAPQNSAVTQTSLQLVKQANGGACEYKAPVSAHVPPKLVSILHLVPPDFTGRGGTKAGVQKLCRSDIPAVSKTADYLRLMNVVTSDPGALRGRGLCHTQEPPLGGWIHPAKVFGFVKSGSIFQDVKLQQR